MSAQIVTANRLADGAVVFRQADGNWGLRIEDAAVAADAPAAEALQAAAAHDEAAALVVGPYLVEVAAADGVPAPVSYRERIRAYGPSRAFHPEIPTRHPAA